MASLSLQGARVLLCGATGGIGRAVHAELDRRGARVVPVSRRGGATDDGSDVAALDLRDPAAVTAAFDLATERLGGLDVVVNAVGVVAFGPVAELDVDVMEELFLTNTFVPILLARAALRVLGEGGVLVQVSGVIAEQNLPGLVAYGASKAAVRAFDEGLRREARRSGIRVVDARPPHTETGLADRPIAGSAPRMPDGLDPAAVAATIVAAIENGPDDLGSDAF